MESGGSGEPGYSKLKNVNIGVLGHVDSGKTSLCKALSTTASTAAFDSNPQSKERGITLDLGFSAFPLNEQFSVTLVDCPGHASLIRTVLGGVQIMDLMILVIDIKKGMQPQSSECLILANIVCPHLIVVLNKVDLLEPSAREEHITKVRRLMRRALEKTRFGSESIVAVSTVDPAIGTIELKNAIVDKLKNITLSRDKSSPFLLAVDHCFTIRGSGSVCTGTVLQGHLKVGDTIEFPELQTTKKVKTMQVFKQPVNEAWAGDRVALGVPGLDAKIVERGIICAPGLISTASRVAILRIYKIQYYKEPVLSRKRYHISIGYSTVTAMVHLFSANGQDEKFDRAKHYKLEDSLEESKNSPEEIPKIYFALLEFDKPIVILPKSLVIGSNLQLVESTTCRLAFHGTVVESNHDKEYRKTYMPTLNLYWFKKKSGTVDRVTSPDAIIAKGFCQKQSNIDHLIGLKVTLRSEEFPKNQEPIAGAIQSRFGQTNKIRIVMDSLLSDVQISQIKSPTSCVVDLVYKEYKFRDKNENVRKLIQ